MIIKLTSAEVKRFVSVALNLNPATFSIEIVQVCSNPIAVALAQAVKDFPCCKGFEKIPAIKRFRELAPRKVDSYGNTTSEIGLADAKWAVENVEQALANLASHNALRVG